VYRKETLITASLAALFLATAPLSATAAEESGGWQFDLAPFYLWATTVNGEMA